MNEDRQPRDHAEGGWRILLPPGWVTLPTEPEAAAVAIKRLLDRSFEGTARDELVQARIQLDQTLRQQAAEARKAGATYLHSLQEPIRDVPVTASLVCVPVPVSDSDSLAGALNHALGDATGIEESGYADAGELPALRRVRRYPTKVSDHPDEPEVTATNVDYAVQLPDESLLLMAFSTVTDQVRDELVALFDAIAGTLHLPEGGER